jgi:hypothetical protein
MPGRGDEIDTAMQHAPHPARQGIGVRPSTPSNLSGAALTRNAADVAHVPGAVGAARPANEPAAAAANWHCIAWPLIFDYTHIEF